MLRAVMRQVLAVIPRGFVVPVLRGPLRGLRWIHGAHNPGCWAGVYEPAVVQALLPHLRPGAVFWDLGAHVGYFALLAARRGAEVVAVEPLPRNVHYLRQHFTLNGLHFRLVESTASDHEGVEHLDLGPGPAFAQVAPHGVRVSCTTLDRLVYRDRFPAPTVMKVDVEGSEARAFRGAQRVLREARPVIVLSKHTRPGDEAEAMLRGLGYAIRELEADLLLCTPPQ
jgi:FkbM family methyltransferase